MSIAESKPSTFSELDLPKIDASVVLLTHYIPLYQLPIYQTLSRRIRDFKVLISTEIEPNRNFKPQWGDLDVSVQKTWTINRTWKHKSAGFNDTLYVHVPRDTRAQLKRINPDIVLSLELGFRSLACAYHRKRTPRSRLILCTYMSQHTEQGRGALRGALRKWLVKQADAITFNGPSCTEVLKSLGANESNLFPFPYAANPNSIYSGPTQRSGKANRRLLCVGQISERKGVGPMVDQLIQYAQDRSHQKIEVTMAGEGPLKDLLNAMEKPENLTVDFVGNVSSDNMPSILEGHGFMLFPTLADEWGLVVNEGLHAAMPVIGSALAQGSTTLIKESHNGWLYDPRDPAALGSVLDKIYALSDEQIATMRIASRESVAHVTPAFAAMGLLNACQSVASK